MPKEWALQQLMYRQRTI